MKTLLFVGIATAPGVPEVILRARVGDTAGYWVPTVYQDGVVVVPLKATVYYRDMAPDPALLVEAIANYKARGYRIAVGRFGRREINFALLQEIGPAIVKFDPLLLSSTRPLGHMVGRLHELGAQVMIEGQDSAALRQDAQESGFDLLQVLAPRHHLLPAVEADSFA